MGQIHVIFKKIGIAKDTWKAKLHVCMIEKNAICEPPTERSPSCDSINSPSKTREVRIEKSIMALVWYKEVSSWLNHGADMGNKLSFARACTKAIPKNERQNEYWEENNNNGGWSTISIRQMCEIESYIWSTLSVVSFLILLFSFLLPEGTWHNPQKNATHAAYHAKPMAAVPPSVCFTTWIALDSLVPTGSKVWVVCADNGY